MTPTKKWIHRIINDMRSFSDGVMLGSDFTFMPAHWPAFADRSTCANWSINRSGVPEFEFHMPMGSSRRWTPQQIVDLAYSVRPPTEPGRRELRQHRYVLVGISIEPVTGDSLAGQIYKCILARLGLRETFASAGEPFP